MACFTTEHKLHIDQGASATSCRIDEDIWLLHRLNGFKFEMYKFSIHTNCWVNVEYKNRHLIEGDNGVHEHFNSFVIGSWNNKIYMWREYRSISQLFEFDPKTLEWKILRNIDLLGIYSDFVILDNDMYINLSNMHLVVMSMDTFQLKNHIKINRRVSLFQEQTDRWNMCELNGLVYMTRIETTGRRTVHYYDKDNGELVEVDTKIENIPDYLKHDMLDFKFTTFIWTQNNKICHAVQLKYGTHLIIDCFDEKKKEWKTVFTTKMAKSFISSMTGYDNKVYMTCHKIEDVSVKIIDLEPNLEMLSLISVVDNICYNSSNDYYELLLKQLPYELREKYTNIHNWKLKERIDMYWIKQIAIATRAYIRSVITSTEIPIPHSEKPMKNELDSIYDSYVLYIQQLLVDKEIETLVRYTVELGNNEDCSRVKDELMKWKFRYDQKRGEMCFKGTRTYESIRGNINL